MTKHLSRQMASTSARPASPREYRMSDYPLHYFAAIQRQNQLSLSRLLTPISLSVQMWRVLSALYDRGMQNIGQLADATVLDRSALGRLLEEMDRMGLVDRTSPPQDRRSLVVQLSKKGIEQYLAALPLIEEHYRKLLRGVSPQDLKVLVATLRRMKANALMMSDATLEGE